MPTFKNQKFKIKNLSPCEKWEDLATLGQLSHKELTGAN